MALANLQQNQPKQPAANDSTTPPPQSVSELQLGTELTRSRLFQAAIPHLLAAQQTGRDPYATGVNLAICYLGLNAGKNAIAVLERVRALGFNTASVENLLAQAYLADGQGTLAWRAFHEGSRLTPKDEKLYAFVADACTDHQAFGMGLRVAETGIEQLPDSARLHYERGLFLARLDRLPEGKTEFERVIQLAPGTYLATLALIQMEMYNEEFAKALTHLREVVHSGHRDYQTLSLLGTVMLHIGVTPGERDFSEARAALEESASVNPNYSATQIALGQMDSMEGRFGQARDHLECARTLEPANPAIYAGLAHVYRKLGDLEKAGRMQVELARILAEKKTAAGPQSP